MYFITQFVKCTRNISTYMYNYVCVGRDTPSTFMCGFHYKNWILKLATVQHQIE